MDVFVTSSEEAGIGQNPDGLPNLPAALLAKMLALPTVRPLLAGPSRATFVVVFDGLVPKYCRVDTDGPPSGDDAFARDVRRIWDSYAVGHTIPVVMCRILPSPFTGIMVVPLPGAEPKPFCQRCGALTPGNDKHAC